MVPHERRYETPGTNSSSGLVRLTPGPNASLARDLAENHTVAHITVSDASGYVIVYSDDRIATMQDRSIWPRNGRAVCPHFELQPGVPSDRRISVHLPRTSLDKQEARAP